MTSFSLERQLLRVAPSLGWRRTGQDQCLRVSCEAGVLRVLSKTQAAPRLEGDSLGHVQRWFKEVPDGQTSLLYFFFSVLFSHLKYPQSWDFTTASKSETRWTWEEIYEVEGDFEAPRVCPLWRCQWGASSTHAVRRSSEWRAGVGTKVLRASGLLSPITEQWRGERLRSLLASGGKRAIAFRSFSLENRWNEMEA